MVLFKTFLKVSFKIFSSSFHNFNSGLFSRQFLRSVVQESIKRQVTFQNSKHHQIQNECVELPAPNPESKMSPATISQDPGAVPSCVLVLNAFPGTGKSSVAKGMRDVLPISMPTRVIDNHLTIDLVEAVEPVHGKAHNILRAKVEGEIFAGLAASEKKELIVVIPANLSASKSPYENRQIHQYAKLAAARCIPLVLINLHCDEAKNCARLTSAERRVKAARGKKILIEPRILLEYRRNFKLIDPSEIVKQGIPVPFYHLELDTSRLDVEKTAEAVVGFLKDLTPLSPFPYHDPSLVPDLNKGH